MNDKVIYTSLVGNYDTLKDPKCTMIGWDYICFSNDLNQENYSIWEIRPIPFKHKNNLRLSRYAKLNPHIVLPEYNYSFWIDSNISIVNNHFEEILNQLIGNINLIAIPLHPFRNCIYKEAESCIQEGRDIKKIIEQQINFMRESKFPNNFGLFENNLIFRQHNDKMIIELDHDWWNIYMKYSKRDQLSLAFLLWDKKIKCEPLFPNGQSARNYGSFIFNEHKSSIIKRVKTSLLLRLNKYFNII